MLTKNEKVIFGMFLGIFASMNSFYITTISAYNYMLRELGVINVFDFVLTRLPMFFFGQIVIFIGFIVLIYIYIRK